MIPILYRSDTNNYDTNGLGFLIDTINCKVTEERNGLYELELTYPITGRHYSDIRLSCIIRAKNSKNGNDQLFRIYKISKPISGKVSIYAEHISYQLNQIPVMPFDTHGELITAEEMFYMMKNNSAEDCPFTFDSHVDSTSSLIKIDVPTQFRSCLGGIEGSMLDHFHGEFEWDNYVVRLHQNRGSDKGVTLRYGKNIIDLMQEENIENTITGICPFWKGTDEENNELVVTYDGKVVHSENATNFPYKRTMIYDFSPYFEEAPTSDELKKAAEDYIYDNKIGVPEVHIRVSFVDLTSTEDYKHLIPLETVNLCDTITIIFDQLGVFATAKIIKTVYDVMKEAYDSIEIGSEKTNLPKTISDSMVNSFDITQGSAATCTFPSLSSVVSSENLTLTWTGGTFVSNKPTSIKIK